MPPVAIAIALLIGSVSLTHSNAFAAPVTPPEAPKDFSEEWYKDRISEISAAKTELSTLMDACERHKKQKNEKEHSDCIEERAFSIAAQLDETARKMNQDTWVQTLEILGCNNGDNTSFDLKCVSGKIKVATATLDTVKRQYLERLKRLEQKNAIATLDNGNALNRSSESQIAERKASNSRTKNLKDATTIAPAASKNDAAAASTGKTRTPSTSGAAR